MLLRILYYYFVVFIIIVLLYLVGAIVLYPFDKDSFRKSISKIFINLLLGLTLSITAYSIILTGFKTVNLFFVLLYLILFIHRKNVTYLHGLTNEYSELSWVKLILLFSLVILIYYLFFLLTIINVFDWTLSGQTIDVDSSFYSKLSQYLSLGYENLYFARNFSENLGVQPYHYFEIWLTSMVSSFFNIPSLVSYSVITPGILSIIFFIGILALRTIKVKLSLPFIIFVFVLSFVSFNYARLILKIFPGYSNYFFDLRFVGLTNKTSFIPTSIFFIAFLFFQQRKESFLALICLLGISIISINVAPAILGGVVLLIIFSLIFRKSFFSEKLFIRDVVIFIVLYTCYLFIARANENNTDFFNFNFQIFYEDIKWYLIRFLISYSPFILVIVALRNKINNLKVSNETFFMYLAVLSSGLLMSGLASGNFNGKQFFNNVAIPLSNVLIIFIFFNYNYQKINLSFKLAIGLLVFFCFTSSFMGKIARTRDLSKQYKLEVISEVRAEKRINSGENVFIGSLRSKDYYQDKTPFQTAATSLIDYHDLGQFLLLFENKVIIIGLSDMTASEIFNYYFDEPIKTEALKSIEKGTFYNYVLKYQTINHFVPLAQIQIDFIKKMKIKFLFVEEKTEVSSALEKYLKLICSDTNSKEKFYKIQI